MIASTATNWISAGAATAVVILGIIVAWRQGKIEASQLDISKQLRALDEQRFDIERTPVVLIVKSGRANFVEPAPHREFLVMISNVGRGAALRVHAAVTLHTTTEGSRFAGDFDREVLLPGESAQFTPSIPSIDVDKLEGYATMTGFCLDIDGNRHEITPPPPMKPTPDPVAA